MNKNTSKNASTQLIRDAAGMTSAKMDQAPGNWIMQHADSFQVKLQETTLQASTHTHTVYSVFYHKRHFNVDQRSQGWNQQPSYR